MTPAEQAEAIQRTSLRSAEKLKTWLEASGRRWLVFNALDLVDALPWPNGHAALQQIIMAYGAHRGAIDSGRFEVIATMPGLPQQKVPIFKTELLEVEELDRAIRFLIGQITAKDPTWQLTNPPL
jgi:hypothetical protein